MSQQGGVEWFVRHLQIDRTAFGGPGYRTLFITARTSLYGVKTQTRGWHVHLDGVPPGAGPARAKVRK